MRLRCSSLWLATVIALAASSSSAQFIVEIDATALSAPDARLSGTPFATEEVFCVELLAGNHDVSYLTLLGDDPRVSFTVELDGTIDYDSSLDGILEGRGTDSLTVHGAEIDLDLGPLSAPTLRLTGIASDLTPSLHTLRLLPGGLHRLSYLTLLGADPGFIFSVLDDGTVDYDQALHDGMVLAGLGTQDLVVNGAAIDLELSELSVQTLRLTGISSDLAADLHPLKLLPDGLHRLSYLTLLGDDPGVVFSALDDGTIDYDPALDVEILSGLGGQDLTVHGAAVTLDLAALSPPALRLTGLPSDLTPASHALRLLPDGLHRLSYLTLLGDDPGIVFSILDDGNFDYDAALDLEILSGLGSDLLTVHGAAIHLDLTLLSAPTLRLTGLGSDLDRQSHPLALLPDGLHRLSYLTVLGDDPGVEFSVLDTGTVDYDPALDGVILSGLGTETLNVDGADVDLDLGPLSAPTLSLTGIASDLTPTLNDLRLLPDGLHRLSYPTLLGDDPGGEFSVDGAGLFNYDETLDGVFLGQGTGTLLAQGLDVTVDAQALGDTTFDIPGIGSFSTLGPEIVTFLPGSHTFSTSDFDFTFFAVADQTIDYDTFLDEVVLGRDTNTLVVLGDPGQPPTLAERVASLRDATEQLDSPVTTTLLAVVDAIDVAIGDGTTLKAAGLLGFYINVVDSGIEVGLIDPVEGDLLLSRATLIDEELFVAD